MEGTSNGGIVINGDFCKLDMKLNCKDFNVIYVANCRLCNNGFYFGQTWHALNIHMNNHRAEQHSS